MFAPLGRKVFFSSHFCGGFGWSRSGSEVFRTSYYWRPARVGANLSVNTPAACTSVSPQVKCTAQGHESLTALTLLAVIVFLWFSAVCSVPLPRRQRPTKQNKICSTSNWSGKNKSPFQGGKTWLYFLPLVWPHLGEVSSLHWGLISSRIRKTEEQYEHCRVIVRAR